MDRKYLEKEYILNKKSTTDIAHETGKSISTVRLYLIKYGMLRSRKEGFELSKHKFGKHLKGKKRVFTDEWRDNMKKSALKRHEHTAVGISLKPSGYYEITRGVNKGRGLHCVIMEIHIGRKIKKNEVVHHINHIKTDNRIENLELMTCSEHARIHAIHNLKNRNRNNKGQFK